MSLKASGSKRRAINIYPPSPYSSPARGEEVSWFSRRRGKV
jgi:hypothetical protein